jgi:hypothetical protein
MQRNRIATSSDSTRAGLMCMNAVGTAMAADLDKSVLASMLQGRVGDEANCFSSGGSRDSGTVGMLDASTWRHRPDHWYQEPARHC